MKGWKKCPSVTPGGKPFFYHNAAKKLWVVWDRVRLEWSLEGRTKEYDRVIHALRKTKTAAMKAAERIAV